MLKIGLLPISGKPYHRGHHSLVEKACKENDQVLLFVSLSDRVRSGEYPIMGSSMTKVWSEELEKIMPENVTIEYGGSPVRKIYEMIGELCEEGTSNIFTIYSDPTDTLQNYPSKNRVKYMEPLWEMGQIKFAAEEDPNSVTRGIGTPDIKGEDLRHALKEQDFYSFSLLMPDGVDARKIYEILSTKTSSENPLLKDFVAAVIG